METGPRARHLYVLKLIKLTTGNDHGNLSTPSCIGFTESGRTCGELAKSHMQSQPFNTIYSALRMMNRNFDDAEVKSLAWLQPFEVADWHGRPAFNLVQKGDVPFMVSWDMGLWTGELKMC